MSKILDVKDAMQDFSIKELRIMQRWIADEIAIKEGNEKIKHGRVKEELKGIPADKLV
jgi:hypothetical protein